MKQSKLYTKNEGGNCHRGHNQGSEKKYRSRYDRHKKITKFEIDNEITRKKSHYNKNKRTNYDSLIGKEILITEKVSIKKPGAGKVRDVEWTVSTEDAVGFDVGEYAVVESISGNRLIVKRKEN